MPLSVEACVSTEEQATDPQTGALKAAGCTAPAGGGAWDVLIHAMNLVRDGLAEEGAPAPAFAGASSWCRPSGRAWRSPP